MIARISQFVWIVSLGENGCGGSTLEVFASRTDAVDFVKHNYPSFVRGREDQDFVTYRDGCDWIDVRKHFVK